MYLNCLWQVCKICKKEQRKEQDITDMQENIFFMDKKSLGRRELKKFIM